MTLARKYGFLWVTGAFFLITLTGHWAAGWFAYANEARARNQPAKLGDFAVEATRDTLENWQSEFLQLVWQVAGLTFLLSVGSTQSKEGHERLEAKVDYLLSRTEEGRRHAEELERRYPKK